MPGFTGKMQPTVCIKTSQVLVIVLAGTLVRLVYGLLTKAWLGSPDQLAWGLEIDAMRCSKDWNYTQLAHAPHEGASFFISIFSLLFHPFQSVLPSLSVAALAIDALGRFVQIRIAQKLFGYQTALWSGLWSVFAVPALIPWATVNFGLHALLSFVPFVFCWVVLQYRQVKYFPAICGLFCGIAISLSYNSIVLAATAMLFFLFERKGQKIKNLLLFFIVLTAVLLPHVFTRMYYALQNEAVLGIRGISLSASQGWKSYIHLFNVWFTSLPGSLLLQPGRILSGIVFVFLLLGMSLYMSKQSPFSKFFPFVTFAIFIIAYSLSPFYGSEYGNIHYVYYRHLCYIIPLMMVMVINGFVSAGEKTRISFATDSRIFTEKSVLILESVAKIITVLWLLLCGAATIYYIATSPKATPTYKAAGWILAKKHERNMAKLFAIPTITPIEYRAELIQGFGWGMCAAMLQQNDTGSVERLITLIHNAPQEFAADLREGVRYAFAKGVTPVLNPSLLAEFDSKLSFKPISSQ